MSRELLKQCLDLITDLDKEGLILESGLIFALRNELAKPEQEPVAWAAPSIYGGFEGLSFDKQPRFDTPLYALEETK